VNVNDVCAGLAVRDIAQARAWYSDVLGRGPDLEPIEGVAEWQMCSTAWLQLFEDPGRAGHAVVRLGVDRLADVTPRLAELGIAIPEPVNIADMVLVLDVRDPDGNEVSFVQELPPS